MAARAAALSACLQQGSLGLEGRRSEANEAAWTESPGQGGSRRRHQTWRGRRGDARGEQTALASGLEEAQGAQHRTAAAGQAVATLRHRAPNSIARASAAQSKAKWRDGQGLWRGEPRWGDAGTCEWGADPLPRYHLGPPPNGRACPHARRRSQGRMVWPRVYAARHTRKRASRRLPAAGARQRRAARAAAPSFPAIASCSSSPNRCALLACRGRRPPVEECGSTERRGRSPGGLVVPRASAARSSLWKDGGPAQQQIEPSSRLWRPRALGQPWQAVPRACRKDGRRGSRRRGSRTRSERARRPPPAAAALAAPPPPRAGTAGSGSSSGSSGHEERRGRGRGPVHPAQVRVDQQADHGQGPRVGPDQHRPPRHRGRLQRHLHHLRLLGRRAAEGARARGARGALAGGALAGGVAQRRRARRRQPRARVGPSSRRLPKRPKNRPRTAAQTLPDPQGEADSALDLLWKKKQADA
jgi:hypothetical protein